MPQPAAKSASADRADSSAATRGAKRRIIAPSIMGIAGKLPRMRRTVVLAGYYGFGNTGDEAILASILAGLRRRVPGTAFIVVSGDPEATRTQHGVEAVGWRDVSAISASVAKSDVVLVGGGGLFQDYWGLDTKTLLTPRHGEIAFYAGPVVLAALARKPALLYGLGFGPLASSEARRYARAVADAAVHLSVRDEASRDLLVATGVPEARITVTADPAFALEVSGGAPAPADLCRAAGVEPLGPILGVALRPWSIGVEQAGWESEVAAALAQFLEQTGGTLLFVPFEKSPWTEKDDFEQAARLAAALPGREHVAIAGALSPRETAAVLSGCDLVLGMRLHSLVFAAAGGVPAVGLAYDPKVTALLSRLGGVPALPLAKVTSRALLDALLTSLKESPAIASRLRGGGRPAAGARRRGSRPRRAAHRRSAARSGDQPRRPRSLRRRARGQSRPRDGDRGGPSRREERARRSRTRARAGEGAAGRTPGRNAPGAGAAPGLHALADRQPFRATATGGRGIRAAHPRPARVRLGGPRRGGRRRAACRCGADAGREPLRRRVARTRGGVVAFRALAGHPRGVPEGWASRLRRSPGARRSARTTCAGKSRSRPPRPSSKTPRRVRTPAGCGPRGAGSSSTRPASPTTRRSLRTSCSIPRHRPWTCCTRCRGFSRGPRSSSSRRTTGTSTGSASRACARGPSGRTSKSSSSTTARRTGPWRSCASSRRAGRGSASSRTPRTAGSPPPSTRASPRLHRKPRTSSRSTTTRSSPAAGSRRYSRT